jgi:hypothetical protein
MTDDGGLVCYLSAHDPDRDDHDHTRNYACLFTGPSTAIGRDIMNRKHGRRADDFAAMELLFGDDLLYTHSSGKTDNKACYIELQRSKAVIYRSMQRSDVTVRTHGCIAIITGNAHYQVTAGGKDITPELVFHSIWAKRDGGVQFISWQSTAAPKP